MGGGKPQELALGNSSALARLAGGRVPWSPTKARRAVAALPEGPTHTPSSRSPVAPRAQSKQPRSRTPTLQLCTKSLLWSTFLGQLSPPVGRGTRACWWAACAGHRLVVRQGSGLRYLAERSKGLQKRTRNTAALGMAPALAGKLRHALEGMGVPLEDNQRFRLSPTSFYLQSQRSQKAGSPPPPRTRQPLLTAAPGDTST